MYTDLDDKDNIQRIDVSNTSSQIADFASNLLEATRYEAPDIERPRSVCMSGIGGSAMAADILQDYLAPVSKLMVAINRNVALPAWINSDSLSIITSYSGNTQEALDVLDHSVKAGCEICCITSGGKLLERCVSNGIPHVKVPGGIQPRAALGYLLGAASAVLEKIGAGTPATDFGKAAQNSLSASERMSPKNPTESNIAKKLALRMEDMLPAIYAPKNIRSVAVRWQNQINENSKMVAFSGEVPEMNHNQMVGWLQGSGCAPCRPLFLLPSMMDPTIERMTMVTIQMFTEAKLEPMVVPLHGNTHAENLVSGVMLGDNVSYYLAILKGCDPGPVPVIQDFKSRIA
ncbi:MAG: bifunctional phosphoglucose/phosphomannose isomerase [Euryarchaeota archaeon]|nr:bifunctional phosphoglucose/phosphomannose isomerase [Euryarchaeota archaeon]